LCSYQHHFSICSSRLPLLRNGDGRENVPARPASCYQQFHARKPA
jgi:hypothetical protein